MPRGVQRAKRRHARLQQDVNDAVAETEKARNFHERVAANERLVAVARTIAHSEFTLSSFEPEFCSRCKTPSEWDEMHALMSQVRAPQLAGPRPRSVHLRSDEP